MASLNKKVKTPPVYTHEGGRAKRITDVQQLERSVLATMLWEDGFYEDGIEIADRITDLATRVPMPDVHRIAIRARKEGNLRHVPLLLSSGIAARDGNKLSELLPQIIQRPDELTEFLAIYWRNGKVPVSAQIKKGLAKSFVKFSKYQLLKYNRPGKITLKDVMALSHPRPKNKEQGAMWKALLDGTLKADRNDQTWENRLSAGEDKKATFADLMAENKLGGMAYLRNLRNMAESGVDRALIREYATKANFSKVLPFRFLAARNAAPDFEQIIENAMFRSLAEAPKLKGHTVVLLDESGSMRWGSVSEKSDLRYIDAANALGMIAREICEDATLVGFDTRTRPISGRGFAIANRHIPGGGTDLRQAVAVANAMKPDRIICITDEQSRTTPADPHGIGYMINVASNRNGVGYGAWTHLDGFSEAVLKWIVALENL